MKRLSRSMVKYFVIDCIVKSFNWLGHAQHGYTMLMALHRDYRPDKANYEKNLKLRLFPKIWFVKKAEAAVKFVKCFYQDHICCYGINPVEERLKTDKGHNRRANDGDIKKVMNFYLDIDPVGEPSDEQIAELELLLEKTEPYFADLGINQPTRAFTGRGYHLLFPVPPISVKDHPDIKNRLNQFMKDFQQNFGKGLSELELKLDNTMDLSRVAKIYGTRKPNGLRVSRFYGGPRVEDEALKNHLLSMPVEEQEDVKIVVPKTLPERFERLLKEDEITRQLWQGEGKTLGDTSGSGYDFSLVRRCLRKGITDVTELSAILALRPQGDVQAKGKGYKYVRLTIANAIKP